MKPGTAIPKKMTIPKNRHDVVSVGRVVALIAASLAWGATPAPAQVDLVGTVRDSVSNEVLPNVLVSVDDHAFRVFTNQFGRFVLIGLPAATDRVLRVEHLGYETREMALDADAGRALSIQLVPRAIEIDGVTVTATTATDIVAQGDAAGQIALSPQRLGTLPSLGETDVFRTLQLLPGVSGTNDATPGLFVRGGTPDENLVLLDGMTVYHVDHFFGVFSAFNSDAVQAVRLFKGGFPAQYGGRTSSVVGGDARRGVVAVCARIRRRQPREGPHGPPGQHLATLPVLRDRVRGPVHPERRGLCPDPAAGRLGTDPEPGRGEQPGGRIPPACLDSLRTRGPDRRPPDDQLRRDRADLLGTARLGPLLPRRPTLPHRGLGPLQPVRQAGRERRHPGGKPRLLDPRRRQHRAVLRRTLDRGRRLGERRLSVRRRGLFARPGRSLAVLHPVAPGSRSATRRAVFRGHRDGPGRGAAGAEEARRPHGLDRLYPRERRT